MVFQDYALYPHWQSEDNLGFFFQMHQRKHEIPERVRITARVMGLGFETLLSQKPPKLSGGQQQRVAIARAIIRDPRTFLFDEPLSNLDAKVRARTRVEIRRLIQRFGITSVYVTHDQSEAFTMGDRIAVMHNGRILQVDTRKQIVERPLNIFVADFISVPAMNLMPGVVYREFVDIHDRKVTPPPIVLQQYQTERVTIGIRPTDVVLRSENEEGHHSGQDRDCGTAHERARGAAHRARRTIRLPHSTPPDRAPRAGDAHLHGNSSPRPARLRQQRPAGQLGTLG